MRFKQIAIWFGIGIVMYLLLLNGFVAYTPYEITPKQETIEITNQVKEELVNDYDLDGIKNKKEKTIGTDPRDEDTDNDGFSDAREREVPSLDPLRKDVIVEVDYQRGTNKTDFSSVIEAYNRSPVENPDGTTGINLQIIRDDTQLNLPDKYNSSFHINQSTDYYNYEKYGYHHAIVVENPYNETKNEQLGGFYTFKTDNFVIKDTNQEQFLMHELGHALGLKPAHYSGIDSRQKTINEYNSVMNYNFRDYQPPRYSTNKSKFNDWEFISNSLDIVHPSQ